MDYIHAVVLVCAILMVPLGLNDMIYGFKHKDYLSIFFGYVCITTGIIVVVGLV